MNKIKIVITDDNPSFLRGVEVLIGRNEHMIVDFTASDEEELLNKLSATSKRDLPHLIC